MKTLEERFEALPARRQLAIIHEAQKATVAAWQLSNIQMHRVIRGALLEMEHQEKLERRRAGR
jgi:hypothetical protein